MANVAEEYLMAGLDFLSPALNNAQWAMPAPSSGYMTPLPPDQEAQFRSWVARNHVPFDPSPVADYDMRGFWQAQGQPGLATAINPNDNMLHFPDRFKTPYHQSFSSESQWALPSAPSWNNRDQLVLPDGRVVFDERAR